MKENLFANSLGVRMNLTVKKLRLQRNIVLIITVMVMINNVLIAVKLYNQEIITRLVPTITAEQIISEKYVNDEALKARAKELIWLIFSMKKENVDEVSADVLRQVDNAYIDDFKQQIAELSADIQDKNYRYVFRTIGYEFDNQNFTVKVQGHLETFMAGKQLSEIYKEYFISFINRGGVLTVKSFEEMKEASNEHN